MNRAKIMQSRTPGELNEKGTLMVLNYIQNNRHLVAPHS